MPRLFAVIGALVWISVSGPAPAMDTAGWDESVLRRVSNDYLVIKIDPANGRFSIETGPRHPNPGKNVFYQLGTSYITVRDVEAATIWVNKNPSSAENPDGFTSTSMADYASTVTLGTNGFRTTYNLPSLQVVQDVVIEGATLGETVVRHTTTVSNTTSARRSFGLRYLWDWKIADNDASYFRTRAPDGEYSNYFASSTDLKFARFEEVDSLSRPTFSIFGTISGGLNSMPPTPPEELRYCSFAAAAYSPWDFSNEGGQADSGVCYYWGKSAPLLLGPGEFSSFTQYVTTEYSAIKPRLDFGMTVDSPPGPAEAETSATYTLSWSNTGDTTLSRITVIDTLPAGAVYQSPSSVAWQQPDFPAPPTDIRQSYARSISGPWKDGEPANGTASPLILRWIVLDVAPAHTGFVQFTIIGQGNGGENMLVVNRAAVKIGVESVMQMTGEVKVRLAPPVVVPAAPEIVNPPEPKIPAPVVSPGLVESKSLAMSAVASVALSGDRGMIYVSGDVRVSGPVKGCVIKVDKPPKEHNVVKFKFYVYELAGGGDESVRIEMDVPMIPAVPGRNYILYGMNFPAGKYHLEVRAIDTSGMEGTQIVEYDISGNSCNKLKRD